MSQIVVFPRGQLTADDRAAMASIGVVAVEAENPEWVVTAIPMVGTTTLIDANDMLMAALHAAVTGGTAYKFADEMYRRLKAREIEKLTKEPTNDR